MAEKFILGVDGGNSKTDYLLCRADGTFVDILRASNCSHENNDRGYDWMQETMQGHVDTLCKKNNIKIEDIVAVGFGLAGADEPGQVKELTNRIKHIGFTRFEVANDGILGVKAIASSGVCSINGSGTVTLGIDDTGKLLQVGGIGGLSGDAAGGGHISSMAVKMVYHAFFRAGKKTSMADGVLNLMKLNGPEELHAAINRYGWRSGISRELIQLADREAQAGDEVAMKIFDDMGVSMAEGVVGCVQNLTFNGEIVVVKAGSIWNVIGYKGMIDHYVRTIREGIKNPVRFELLETTPALGALFWAKELLDGSISPKYREEMRSFLTPEKYAEIAGGITDVRISKR
jgi:N-acetylglucosamine kinase-like BadF-type ATPase